MAINRDCLGRTYESKRPYEVTRVKISEFATAIGDPDPRYTDPDRAKKDGHPDVVAPPTFPIVLGMEGAGRAAIDPDLGLDFSMVVHGSQRFVYSRPMRAGDVVTTTTRITDIKSLGRTEMITLESDIATVDGEHVVTSVNMLVVRSAGPDAE